MNRLDRGLLSRIPAPLQTKIEEELNLAFIDAYDMLDDLRDLLREIEALLGRVFYGESRTEAAQGLNAH